MTTADGRDPAAAAAAYRLRELRRAHFTARRSARETPPPRVTSLSQPAVQLKHHFPKQQLSRRHQMFFVLILVYSEVTDIFRWINRPLNENFNPLLGTLFTQQNGVASRSADIGYEGSV